jgi:hypothetical protein
LYRYTPGSGGRVRILACKSMRRNPFYWMENAGIVLQKG